MQYRRRPAAVRRVLPDVLVLDLGDDGQRRRRTVARARAAAESALPVLLILPAGSSWLYGALPPELLPAAVCASDAIAQKIAEAIGGLHRNAEAPQADPPRLDAPFFDPVTRELIAASGAVRLTPREAEVFSTLLQRRGQITPPELLSRLLWGEARPDRHARAAVRAHIYTLRRRLRPLGLDGAIESVRGGGYRLTLPPEL